MDFHPFFLFINLLAIEVAQSMRSKILNHKVCNAIPYRTVIQENQYLYIGCNKLSMKVYETYAKIMPWKLLKATRSK